MYSVRVADLLYAGAESEEEKKEASRKFYRTSLLAVHAFDVLFGVILLFAACDWKQFGSCVIGSVFQQDGYSLKKGSAVCLLLALSRVVVFPAVTKLAITYGVESAHLSDGKAKPGKADAGNGQESGKENGASDVDLEMEDELQVRLLVHEAELAEGEAKEENPYDRSYATNRANFAKYLFMSSIFVFSCAYQIYAGIKVSNYEWKHEETMEILSICISVFWINIMAYLYRSLIEDETAEEGLYFAHVHRHPIFWTKGLYLHICDMCKEKIKNEKGGAFRCKLCDYDICIKCVKRKDLSEVAEDLIRSDRGVKMESKVSSGSYFTRSLEMAKPEWPLLSISLACLVLNCVTNLALPHIQGQVINDLIARDEETFVGHLKVYLCIMLSQGLFTGVSNFLFVLVSRKITFHVRNRLFESIIKQDVAFFDGTTSGHLTSKLTYDILNMMYPIRASLSTLLQNAILLIGGIGMCYYNSYKLSLLAFVTVGPIMFLWDLYGQFSKRLNRKMLVAWGNANSSATEALNHIRDVKSFCNEDHELGLYSDANNLALQAGIKDAVASGVTQTMTGYLDLGTGVLILWFGGFLALSDAISIGELVAFQFYWNMMNNSYQNLQGLMVQFTQSAAAAEKVFSIWDNTPDIDDSSGKPIDWEVKGKLTLKNVSFFYQMRPDNKVLTDVNLEIPASSVCAFVGRSGGGKTTLVKMLLRFYDPKSGSLYLDDHEYASLKVSDLRGYFGCVAQKTTLFAKSLLYNITYGLDPDSYTMEDVIEACKKAQCYDFIMDFKDTFETRCGEAGVRISGGQGQRIAIARVFLRKPKVILLDEATSALDEESQNKVQEALNLLLQSKSSTIVLVAHRLSTVQFADKIAVIDKGVVLEEGSHAELLKKENGVYRKLVSLKVEKEKSLMQNSQISGSKTEKTKQPESEGLETMMEEIMKAREEETEKANKAEEAEKPDDAKE